MDEERWRRLLLSSCLTLAHTKLTCGPGRGRAIQSLVVAVGGARAPPPSQAPTPGTGGAGVFRSSHGNGLASSQEHASHACAFTITAMAGTSTRRIQLACKQEQDKDDWCRALLDHAHDTQTHAKRGWIYKKGEVNTQWKGRFFVLECGKLSWYLPQQVHANSSLHGEAKGWVSCLGLRIEAESASVCVQGAVRRGASMPSVLSATISPHAPFASPSSPCDPSAVPMGSSGARTRLDSLSSLALDQAHGAFDLLHHRDP